jgi:crotonobetainyl-CoA:carnitine CoA-transferase CaiB-like acyl-CoA transferase
VPLQPGEWGVPARRSRPRVLDLSALWAGPLSTHLLWLAGAEVIKVESRRRPDAMRNGDPTFYALLNQGKASVVLDFDDPADRQALAALIAASDVVVEASRPRALQQLGIDAVAMIRNCPGLTWLTITAHGASEPEAQWVGFGDDCGVAGGLSAALLAASGRAGFVGDAIADPLTGIVAANAAWSAWQARRGGRIGVAMSQVVAHCLSIARQQDAAALTHALLAWSKAVGRTFSAVTPRSISALSGWGEDTLDCLASVR